MLYYLYRHLLTELVYPLQPLDAPNLYIFFVFFFAILKSFALH